MAGMRAIEILRREHGWIAWMAECLETLTAEGRAAGQLPPEASELLFLYETFADGRHQDKEEGVLFGELIAAASDEERTLVGKLLEDHEAERKLMASMRLHLLGALHGEPGCVREFTRAASRYIDLHRSHMHREAAVLFPMAERLLGTAADARVTKGFEQIEGGPGDVHGIEEQILHLRGRVGLPVPPAA